MAQPTLIPRPWASEGSYTAIPDAPPEAAGRASWQDGFPEETARPLGAGGIPPHWLDFQGVLNALSQHICFSQIGGRYAWNSTVAYPVGAVVLGSNGRVYQALQTSTNKNPINAGNSAYWGTLATPDGTTIILDANGKLSAVNQGGDASALADGQTIVADNDKLKVNYGPGLSYDSTLGKLVVDFQDLTVEQVLELCDPAGGIVVNNDPSDTSGYKKLMIDFTSMPDDKFNQLKDSLDMQRTLTANKSIYVDYDNAAASDVYKIRDAAGVLIVDDDRGKEAKPFKTIGGAVNYATKLYALGSYNIHIYVKPRSNSAAANYPYYTEQVVLPQFTATTGAIYIRAYDDANPPQVHNPNPVSTIFRCTGGTWYLRRLKVINTVTAAGSGRYFPCCVGATGGGTVHLQGMDLDLHFSGAIDSGSYYLRVVAVASYGLVSLDTIANYQNKFTYDIGAANGLEVFHLERVGSLQIPSSNTADKTGISDPKDSIYAILCTGTPSTFLTVTTQSLVSYIGGSSYYPRFVYGGTGTPQGKRYEIMTGSGAAIPRLTTASAGEALPGSTAGDADSSTYSWYKEQAVPAIPYS